MKAALLLIFGLVFFACATENETEQKRMFINYVRDFSKHYNSKEELAASYANFKETLDRIQRLNATSKGAIYGLNKFSDMSAADFRTKYMMPKGVLSSNAVNPIATPKGFTAPTSWDWRVQGKVTPVKDQGQCGSCWAFSVTENIESVWMISQGSSSIAPLSPQQIVDCDSSDSGCNGGDPPTAYQYVINAPGLETNAAYPYQGADGSCQFQQSSVLATIGGYRYATTAGDEQTLANNLVAWSPLSICVDASNWQDYNGGVMTAADCGGTSLDHCVQLVGYDTTQNPAYWIVRNSWSASWGISGYIWLSQGENTCGLTQEATTSCVSSC